MRVSLTTHVPDSRPLALLLVASVLGAGEACSPALVSRHPADWPAATPVERVQGVRDPMQPPQYTPRDLASSDNTAVRFWTSVHSETLSILREPSFKSNDSPGMESYRCVILPAFGPRVVVRAVRGSDGHQILTGKVLPDGTAIEDRLKDAFWTVLDSARWSALLRRIEESNFWAIPSSLPGDWVDADTMMLEGLRSGEHRLVWRSGTQAGDPFRSPCLYLLALSGIDVPVR